jgi:hypothetical protein
VLRVDATCNQLLEVATRVSSLSRSTAISSRGSPTAPAYSPSFPRPRRGRTTGELRSDVTAQDNVGATGADLAIGQRTAISADGGR